MHGRTEGDGTIHITCQAHQDIFDAVIDIVNAERNGGQCSPVPPFDIQAVEPKVRLQLMMLPLGSAIRGDRREKAGRLNDVMQQLRQTVGR